MADPVTASAAYQKSKKKTEKSTARELSESAASAGIDSIVENMVNWFVRKLDS